jgi:serine/threonine protein kinase
VNPGVRLGPYELISPLGAGGMGEVWRARDTRLGREVALKILPAELSANPERLGRFEREARAASALNHPNIVVVHDVGRSDSVSYIAMERVHGRSLRELMISGPLPAKKILSLASQVAEGLAAAHAEGIVHRDLKPENVMVSDAGFVKILDFGLAKLAFPSAQQLTAAPTVTVEPPRTEAGVILGTVGYMSPEQAAGREVDYRSDQFSLGSILYEMATGRPAFQGDSTPQTLSAIIEKDPRPVLSIRPDVPGPLVWVIERCLAKVPVERYESTRDLARDLENLRDRLSATNLPLTERGDAAPAEPSPAAAVRKWKLPPLARAIATIAALAAAVVFGGRVLRYFNPGSPGPPTFRQMTFRSGTISAARFAPDGETVVFSAAWEGHPSELFLVRRGSTESRSLGLPQATLLSISRSGEMAILLSRETAFTGTGVLARVPLSGGAPREVLGAVFDADWTPDGQLVAATSEKDHSKLWFPLGREVADAPEPIWGVRVSPDGERVACLMGSFAAVGDVVVFDRSGKKSILSRGWQALFGLGWSPDGREVWFTGTRGDEYPALYGVSMNGKERVLFRAPLSVILADAFRDGSVLLLSNVFKGDISCLLPGEAYERQFGWLDFSSLESLSPDARTLLFTEQRLGGGPVGSVYLRKTDGSPAVRLGEGSGEGLSPDGEWALVTKDYVQWSLLPTGAGSPRTLPRGEATKLFEGDWIDSRRIVFSGWAKDRPLRIYVQDIEGGQPQPITPEGVSIPQNAAVTPDGKAVLGVSESGWALYPVEGGEPRPVRGLGFGEGPVGWSRSGGTVYVRKEQDGPRVEIEALDLASGRRRHWKTLAVPDPSGVVRIHPIIVAPDEKSYCYTSERLLSTLHLVEGIK